jgi:hypothetical protein
MTACNCAHQTHESIQLLYITCCNTASQRNRITQACRRTYLYSCETDATRHAAVPLHEGMIAVTLPCALPCNTGDIIIHARWIRNHAIEIGWVHMHTHTLSDVCTYKSNIQFILLASTPCSISQQAAVQEPCQHCAIQSFQLTNTYPGIHHRRLDNDITMLHASASLSITSARKQQVILVQTTIRDQSVHAM